MKTPLWVLLCLFLLLPLASCGEEERLPAGWTCVSNIECRSGTCLMGESGGICI
jgi:hypothetical protein